MRHPCDHWGSCPTLSKLVFLSVREALYAPAHPDSKRQRSRKRRDLERYGARILKGSGVAYAPCARLSRKSERQRILGLIEVERKAQAAAVTARLMGKTWTSVPGWTSAEGVDFGRVNHAA